MPIGRVLTATGASTDNIQLIVKIDTGSTVSVTKDDEIINTDEVNGLWYFSDLEAGEWTITCTKGSDTATRTATIVTGEVCQVIELGYQFYASDFNIYVAGTETPAVVGADYEVVYDNDTVIPQELWSTEKNWKYRCLVNIDVVPLRDSKIDVFLVGGAAATAYSATSGPFYGTGGHVVIETGLTLFKNVHYPVVIGAGAPKASASEANYVGGNPTTAFSLIAKGGEFERTTNRGIQIYEWNGVTGKMYSGAIDETGDGPPNTGTGGKEPVGGRTCRGGGSGIVVFRNARTTT